MAAFTLALVLLAVTAGTASTSLYEHAEALMAYVAALTLALVLLAVSILPRRRSLTRVAAFTLALVLLAVTLLWPASQESLYEHAEALMASSRYTDWVTARDQYLEPLDRRFPRNPYRKRTTRWRDQILLKEAEQGAVYPQSAAYLFVFAHAAATEASKHRDDKGAVHEWKKLAAKLHPNNPEQLKWYLAALTRADQLERTIRDRRRFVEEQIGLANGVRYAGQTDAAMARFNNLREQYKGYTDLADLLAALPGKPAPRPSTPGSSPPSGSESAAPK